MKDLVIIGTRGFGRSILEFIKDIREIQGASRMGYIIKGFLDQTDDYKDLLTGHKIIGTPEEYIPDKNELFFCAIGACSYKEKIYQRYKDFGSDFITIRHPSAVIGNNVNLGEGSSVCPNVTLPCDINISDMVAIDMNACVGHDTTIGNFSTVSPGVTICGNVTIEENVFIGAGATIVSDIVLGAGSIIGAGAVVIKDVPPKCIVVGNPGRIIKSS